MCNKIIIPDIGGYSRCPAYNLFGVYSIEQNRTYSFTPSRSTKVRGSCSLGHPFSLTRFWVSSLHENRLLFQMRRSQRHPFLKKNSFYNNVVSISKQEPFVWSCFLLGFPNLKIDVFLNKNEKSDKGTEKRDGNNYRSGR